MLFSFQWRAATELMLQRWERMTASRRRFLHPLTFSKEKDVMTRVRNEDGEVHEGTLIVRSGEEESPGAAIIGGLFNGLILSIPPSPTAIIRDEDGELHEGDIV
jgi:hypothetical protein